MKEFVFSFVGNNYYLDNLKNTSEFGSETAARLIIKPCNYELKLSGEVLNKTICDGFVFEISNKGGAKLFDNGGTLIKSADETDKEYKEFQFVWSDGALIVNFGGTQTIDNFPDCDGEHDRWSERWVCEHSVKFDMV